MKNMKKKLLEYTFNKILHENKIPQLYSTINCKSFIFWKLKYNLSFSLGTLYAIFLFMISELFIQNRHKYRNLINNS